jgi:hypothetical protein
VLFAVLRERIARKWGVIGCAGPRRVHNTTTDRQGSEACRVKPPIRCFTRHASADSSRLSCYAPPPSRDRICLARRPRSTPTCPSFIGPLTFVSRFAQAGIFSARTSPPADPRASVCNKANEPYHFAPFCRQIATRCDGFPTVFVLIFCTPDSDAPARRTLRGTGASRCNRRTVGK